MNQMARYLQVAQPTVWQWEHGQTTPDNWRAQVLREMKRQVDEMDKRRRAEFAEQLATAALTAGLIGFLTFLLTRNDS